MDFTPLLSGLINGGVKGYDEAQADKRLRAQTAQADAKAKLDKAKSLIDLNNEGYQYDEKTGQATPDPGFLDPNNESNKRAMMVARIKASGNPKFMADPPTIRTAYALANQGAALPPELEAYGEHPYHQDLNPLLTKKAPKIDDQAASDAAVAAYEKSMNLPAGSMRGKISVGKTSSAMSNVAGNIASAGRTKTIVQGANDRTQAQIDAANQRAADANALKERLANKKGNPANEAVDKAYAKDYTEYALNGGHERAMQDISELEPLVEQLKNHDTGRLGGMAGLLGDKAVDLQDPELASIRDKYKRNLSKSLKSIFGSRPSQLEYQKQLELGYNPRLSPQENAQRISDQIARLKGEAGAKKAAADYYQQNGTIKGYQGKIGGGLDDLSDDATGVDAGPPAGNISAQRAEAAKKGGVFVNGATMPKTTLDAIRQMPTKGTASAPKIGATKIVGGVTYLRTKKGWESQ